MYESSVFASKPAEIVYSSETNLPETGSSQFNAHEDVATGEIITANLTVRCAEGVTPLHLTLSYPTYYTMTAWSLARTGASLNPGPASPGTLPSATAGAATINFGTVTNIPNGTKDQDDEFVVQLVFLVGTATAGNVGTVAATLKAGASGSTLATASRSYDFVAPNFAVQTYTLSSSSAAEYGTKHNGNIVIRNTGSSPAYTINLNITLPTTYIGIFTVIAVTGSGVNATVVSGDDVSDGEIHVQFDYLPLGTTATITFTLEPTLDVFAGQSILLPLDHTHRTAPSQSDVKGTVSRTITVLRATIGTPTVTFSDQDATTDVALGEIVHLTLSVTFIKGFSPNAEVVVALPKNTTADFVRFIDYAVLSTGTLTLTPATPTVTPSTTNSPEAGMDSVLFSLGTVSNPSKTNPGLITFNVSLYIRDVDVAITNYKPALSTTVRTKDSSQASAIATGPTSQQPITLKLPDLKLDVDSVPSGDAGDTYSVVAKFYHKSAAAGAYAASLSYTLPSALQFDVTPPSMSPAGGSVSVVGSTVTATLDAFPTTTVITLTIPVVLLDSVQAGSTVTDSLLAVAQTRSPGITDDSNTNWQGRTLTLSNSSSFTASVGSWSTVYSTSLTETSTNRLAVGERISYVLTLVIPEGVSTHTWDLFFPTAASPPLRILSAEVTAKGADVLALGSLALNDAITPTNSTFLSASFGQVRKHSLLDFLSWPSVQQSW